MGVAVLGADGAVQAVRPGQRFGHLEAQDRSGSHHGGANDFGPNHPDMSLVGTVIEERRRSGNTHKGGSSDHCQVLRVFPDPRAFPHHPSLPVHTSVPSAAGPDRAPAIPTYVGTGSEFQRFLRPHALVAVLGPETGALPRDPVALRWMPPGPRRVASPGSSSFSDLPFPDLSAVAGDSWQRLRHRKIPSDP